MIITPEQAALKAQQQFDALRDFVQQAARDGQRIDTVERELLPATARPGAHPAVGLRRRSRATATSGRRPRPPRAGPSAGCPSATTAATCRSSAS